MWRESDSVSAGLTSALPEIRANGKYRPQVSAGRRAMPAPGRNGCAVRGAYRGPYAHWQGAQKDPFVEHIIRLAKIDLESPQA